MQDWERQGRNGGNNSSVNDGRITRGSYSQSRSARQSGASGQTYRSGQYSAGTQQGNGRTSSGKAQTERPKTKETGTRQRAVPERELSPREKKKRDKYRRSFNKYYSKNKNKGKSKDELRKEFAAHTRRRRKRKIFEALFVSLLIAVAMFITASLTVLFKIETIQVSGDTRYSAEQIIEASMVKAGDNLWLTTSGKTTENVGVALPYVKKVKITRTLPSTVTLEITETEPEYSIKKDKKYILIDEDGKVLETEAVKKGKTTLLSGIECAELTPGHKLAVSNEENYKLAMEILDYANTHEMTMTKIDVSNINLMTAIYNSRIRLEIGSGSELKTKMKMASEIIAKLKEEGNKEEGVINLKSVTRAFFREEALNPTKAETTTLPTEDITQQPDGDAAAAGESTTVSTTESTTEAEQE